MTPPAKSCNNSPTRHWRHKHINHLQLACVGTTRRHISGASANNIYRWWERRGPRIQLNRPFNSKEAQTSSFLHSVCVTVGKMTHFGSFEFAFTHMKWKQRLSGWRRINGADGAMRRKLGWDVKHFVCGVMLRVLFPQRQAAAALTLLRAHLNTLKRRLADKIVGLNVKPPSSVQLVLNATDNGEGQICLPSFCPSHSYLC